MGNNVAKIGFESQHYFKKKFNFSRIFSEPLHLLGVQQKIFLKK